MCIRDSNKIALAPEREGVEDFVRTITGEGVTVALGHSNATFDEAKKAVDAGASVWVHAYNGMRGLTHRELGMVAVSYTHLHIKVKSQMESVLTKGEREEFSRLLEKLQSGLEEIEI